MLVRALRGVCIGVERHLKVADTADLDPATGQYLINIGAVEEVKPKKPKVDEPSNSAPAKPDK